MTRGGERGRLAIDELHIAGLGVIEEAFLRLAPGFTAITGETGAGKTMIVTALELLLGSRAEASLVRSGARAAVVEARIVAAPSDQPGDGGADELVVSREIPSDGRSRARVDGRLAPASALVDVLGPWVEVHGQGEHARLARTEVQRALVDRFAGGTHLRALAGYRAEYDAWRAVEGRVAALESDARERAREAERLAHEVGEIDAAGLDPEADARLDEELDRLEHAEQLATAAARAAAAIGADGAGEPIGVAVAAAREAAGHDRALRALNDRLEALAAEATDLATELRSYAEAVDTDPRALDELRERRRLIRALERRFGDDVGGVLAYAEQARARLSLLRAAEHDAGDLSALAASQRARVAKLALSLRDEREAAGARLAEAIEEHLADLGMGDARVRVAVAPLSQPGPDGADRVIFLLAANPGEDEQPLARAASGGERSRIRLAVEVALADVDDASVLVFDEVDAGIGGAAATAVGEKLARLARGRQVLCVTHLAQIAAFADVHHVVDKEVRGGRTVTVTREVDGEERVTEVARLLSGTPGREVALEHARALLAARPRDATVRAAPGPGETRYESGARERRGSGR